MASKKIDSYKLFIMEGGKQKAYISCNAKGKFVGYIDFFEKDSVPAPSITNSGLYRLSYPIERLNDIMTTLREESPLFIQIYNIVNKKGCIVGTSNQEPIGEQEGT
jgi:hypothetical protein